MPTITIESSEPEVVRPIPEPTAVLTPSPVRGFQGFRSRVWAWVWPKLISVLSPVLFLGQVAIRLYTLAYIRVFMDKQVNTAHKCPACGCRREHKVQYSADYESLIHVCELCRAEFATPTIESVAKWKIVRREEPRSASPFGLDK